MHLSTHDLFVREKIADGLRAAERARMATEARTGSAATGPAAGRPSTEHRGWWRWRLLHGKEAG